MDILNILTSSQIFALLAIFMFIIYIIVYRICDLIEFIIQVNHINKIDNIEINNEEELDELIEGLTKIKNNLPKVEEE